jgi:hemolysin activation/secretion protein
MLTLLAQLIAPPLQNSPVRLPAPAAIEQKPRTGGPGREPGLEVPASPSLAPPPPGGQPLPSATPAGRPPAAPTPRIQGRSPYSPTQLRRILAPCLSLADPDQRLSACAAILTARLASDGYVNSRVYGLSSQAPGVLEVVLGRVAEVRVVGPDERLNRQARRLLQPLVGGTLHLPSLDYSLQRLRDRPAIGSVKGSLVKLGSDISQAVLSVRVLPGRQPWHGDLSVRNEGSNGSGEGRLVGTLVKGDLATAGDTLLIYGELNSDNNPSLGAAIGSLSYTLPLAEQLNLTGAFGYSRRNLIELPAPQNNLATNQLQGLGQLEWVLKDSLSQRWSVTAALSGSGSDTTFNNTPLPTSVPASVRTPRSGYLRLGVNGSGGAPGLGIGGTVYLLQGLGFATPSDQREELASVGIVAGEATAIGGLVSGAWGFAPSWQLLLRGGGQVAFQPLTSPMQFSLGSDVGIRGLPGQLISGDSGWLGTGEVAWTFWQRPTTALQLVPFLGAGGVTSSAGGFTFQDTVGATGVLVRWLQGANWSAELGWVRSFQTNDNPGPWRDWLLGKGLYARLQYRF